MSFPMERQFLVQSSSSRSKASTCQDRLMTTEIPVPTVQLRRKQGKQSQCGGALFDRSASHGSDKPTGGEQAGVFCNTVDTAGVSRGRQSGTHGCLREPLES